MSSLKDYFNEIAHEFTGYYTGDRSSLVQDIAYKIFRGPGLRRRFADTIRIIGDCRETRILDIGCGPGVYAKYFAERGAKVTAIDISPNMVSIANKTLSEAGLTDVELILGDFLDQTFSSSFDYVLAIGLFDYIEKEKRHIYLKKMHQLTSRKIVITFPRLFVFQTPIRKVLFYIKQQPVYFYTKNMITDMAKCHGFAIRFHNSGPIWTVEYDKK